jgi:hypothetical protein
MQRIAYTLAALLLTMSMPSAAADDASDATVAVAGIAAPASLDLDTPAVSDAEGPVAPDAPGSLDAAIADETAAAAARDAAAALETAAAPDAAAVEVDAAPVADTASESEAPAATEPASETPALASQMEGIKRDLVELKRDLVVLEEDLLYPASSQVAVFLSMDVGEFFALDSVTLKLNGKDVTHYLYTEKQTDALFRGGVQRLYVGNVKQGENQLTAFFTGRGPEGRDYSRAATVTFEKSFEPSFVELKISDSTAKYQPEFVATVSP